MVDQKTEDQAQPPVAPKKPKIIKPKKAKKDDQVKIMMDESENHGDKEEKN